MIPLLEANTTKTAFLLGALHAIGSLFVPGTTTVSSRGLDNVEEYTALWGKLAKQLVLKLDISLISGPALPVNRAAKRLRVDLPHTTVSASRNQESHVPYMIEPRQLSNFITRVIERGADRDVLFPFAFKVAGKACLISPERFHTFWIPFLQGAS